MSELLGILLIVLIVGAAALLAHLGAGRVPHVVAPVMARWVGAGRDPKWIRFVLWGCFWLVATVVMAFVAFGLYEGAIGLGRKF